ncbi:traK protein [Erwinia papayae]|uniref:TraK protein n=1 Tax=Erwinia papayae TaxID=206499 RepID=A0ABV3N7M3_9GAMM
MRLNYRQIEHEKTPIEDMMPIITCKVTDEEKEFIDRLAGTNRSDYMRRCLLAGSGSRIGGLSQVTEQINEVNRRLDILFDQVSETDMSAFSSELKGLVKQLSQLKLPPPGQMMLHESLAIETVILLRSMATPANMKAAWGELERNGYKVWESK